MDSSPAPSANVAATFEKVQELAGSFVEKYNVLIVLATMCLIVISNIHMAGQEKATENLTLLALGSAPIVSLAFFFIPAVIMAVVRGRTFGKWYQHLFGSMSWYGRECMWRYPLLMSLAAAVIISPIIVSTVIACTKNDDGDKVGPKNMGILGGVLFIAFAGITAITVCPEDMGGFKYVVPPTAAAAFLVYFVYVFSNTKRKDNTRIVLSICNMVIALIATIAVCLSQPLVAAE